VEAKMNTALLKNFFLFDFAKMNKALPKKFFFLRFFMSHVFDNF
jgi:hypothetical protein